MAGENSVGEIDEHVQPVGDAYDQRVNHDRLHGPSIGALVAPKPATLHPAPSGGGAFIFQHDTPIEQLLPDAIGFAEVLTPARLLACSDALLDPLLGHTGRRGLQELARLALQETEHATERLELTCGLRVAVEYGVGEEVQLRDGLRRAEVVVHRLAEALRVPLVPVD